MHQLINISTAWYHQTNFNYTTLCWTTVYSKFLGKIFPFLSHMKSLKYSWGSMHLQNCLISWKLTIITMDGSHHVKYQPFTCLAVMQDGGLVDPPLLLWVKLLLTQYARWLSYNLLMNKQQMIHNGRDAQNLSRASLLLFSFHSKTSY